MSRSRDTTPGGSGGKGGLSHRFGTGDIPQPHANVGEFPPMENIYMNRQDLKSPRSDRNMEPFVLDNNDKLYIMSYDMANSKHMSMMLTTTNQNRKIFKPHFHTHLMGFLNRYKISDIDLNKIIEELTNKNASSQLIMYCHVIKNNPDDFYFVGMTIRQKQDGNIFYMYTLGSQPYYHRIILQDIIHHETRREKNLRVFFHIPIASILSETDGGVVQEQNIEDMKALFKAGNISIVYFEKLIYNYIEYSPDLEINENINIEKDLGKEYMALCKISSNQERLNPDIIMRLARNSYKNLQNLVKRRPSVTGDTSNIPQPKGEAKMETSQIISIAIVGVLGIALVGTFIYIYSKYED